MKWYAYLGYFFAGAFLANSVPHFVQGISGQEFRTPFGDPSSATVNVIWGFVNLVVGSSITTALGGLCCAFNRRTVIMALGFLTMAIMLSCAFS
jgi:hypothetical protein